MRVMIRISTAGTRITPPLGEHQPTVSLDTSLNLTKVEIGCSDRN